MVEAGVLSQPHLTTEVGFFNNRRFIMKRSTTLTYCVINAGLNIEIKPSIRRKGLLKSIFNFLFR